MCADVLRLVNGKVRNEWGCGGYGVSMRCIHAVYPCGVLVNTVLGGEWA